MEGAQFWPQTQWRLSEDQLLGGRAVHERAKGATGKTQKIADMQGETYQSLVVGESVGTGTHLIHLLSLSFIHT